MYMCQIIAQEQGSEGWSEPFCIHMGCIQIRFFSQSMSGKGCSYISVLRGQAFFQTADNRPTMTAAQSGHLNQRMEGERKDEISLSISEFICIGCIVWWRGASHMRGVFQWRRMSSCQQGLNSIHADRPLRQCLPSRLHFICRLNAFPFIYSFISTWPGAVTLMNGSWNWPIVFTWRDKPHTLWT